MTELTAVAAISENNALSKDGRLPWTPPKEDKEQYRELIRGHPLIFGENTYDNKERTREVPMLVLSYDDDFEAHQENHTVVHSKREALDWIADQEKEVFVMGGGQTYRLFWDNYDRLVISHIPGEYDGDIFFPEIREEVWEATEVIEYEGFTRKTYRRR